MSFMDTLKDKLGMSKDRTNDITRQHQDDVEPGNDKGGQNPESGMQDPKDAMDDRQDRGDGPA
ncbi:hypothetical protein ACFO3J_27025 [Streptomyces polygonati]|uniref:Antitoxin n=1 Tax=Streptomyces polygonati TaxID=1617087 RepID=A0ABV8HVV3_9ACTN